MSPAVAPRGRRIAIVDPSGYLDTVSVLCDMSQALAEDGWAVDIYTQSRPEFPVPVFEHELISIHPLPVWPVPPETLRLEVLAGRGGTAAALAGILAKIQRKGWALATHSMRALYILRLNVWAVRLRLQQSQAPHRVFIGVDPLGLVWAHELSRFMSVPLAYHSLEIQVRDEITVKGEMRLKRREIELSRLAEFVIIQDVERAGILSVENGIPLDRFVFAPNAPVGPAHRDDSAKCWHEMFSLPSTAKVLLHAGDIGVWTGIDGIVRSAAQLPKDWVLVLHTKYDTGISSRVAALMEIADDSKVFFSLKPVPRRIYGSLVDSADAGVVFYVPTPTSSYTMTNIRVIGLSSGKVANYLRAGLPVIANSECTLGPLAEAEGFGVCVDSGSEIGLAVERIATDYNAFSDRAGEFFDSALDFRSSALRILDRIRNYEG